MAARAVTGKIAATNGTLASDRRLLLNQLYAHFYPKLDHNEDLSLARVDIDFLGKTVATRDRSLNG